MMFLTIMIVICLISMVTCLIYMVFAYRMERFPMLFDRKAYKIWKKCYEANDFYLLDSTPTQSGIPCEMWQSRSLPYHLSMFNENGKLVGGIFDDNSECVFSSFFEHHVMKLFSKIKSKS